MWSLHLLISFTHLIGNCLQGSRPKTSIRMRYLASQYGENPKKPGNPHNVRLYSIASSRYGAVFDGRTTGLCVRRAVYYDPETGKEDPSKNGVYCNFFFYLVLIITTMLVLFIWSAAAEFLDWNPPNI